MENLVAHNYFVCSSGNIASINNQFRFCCYQVECLANVVNIRNSFLIFFRLQVVGIVSELHKIVLAYLNRHEVNRPNVFCVWKKLKVDITVVQYLFKPLKKFRLLALQTVCKKKFIGLAVRYHW